MDAHSGFHGLAGERALDAFERGEGAEGFFGARLGFGDEVRALAFQILVLATDLGALLFDLHGDLGEHLRSAGGAVGGLATLFGEAFEVVAHSQPARLLVGVRRADQVGELEQVFFGARAQGLRFGAIVIADQRIELGRGQQRRCLLYTSPSPRD